MEHRSRIALIAPAALALLLLFFAVAIAGRQFAHSAHRVHRLAAVAKADRTAFGGSAAAFEWGDRFGDGTPDFLRLTDPADQAAFRRWFTLIAEYQAVRPKAGVPAEITDCASLLRYSYREALKRHDEGWFATTGIEVAALPGEIRAWSYPHTPLGAGLFRVRAGAFEPADMGEWRLRAVCRCQDAGGTQCLLREPRRRRRCPAICSSIASSASRRRGTR